MVWDPPKQKVDVTRMLIYSFIPILGIYAAWRIQKFWMLLVLEFVMSIAVVVTLFPLGMIAPELVSLIPFPLGIMINILLMIYFAEKYNDGLGDTLQKKPDDKITNFMETDSTPIQTGHSNKDSVNNSSNNTTELKKIFTKKSLIVGSLVVLGIFLVSHAVSYNTLHMTNDGMYPIIKKNDLVRYDNTSLKDVVVGDIIVYEDVSSGILWIHQVIQESDTELVVQSKKSTNKYVVTNIANYEYIGKVTSIYENNSVIRIITNPGMFLMILGVGFSIPVILIYERSKGII
jgi:hypothetical protein